MAARAWNSSDVNKDLTLKAKAKDSTFKAKANAKDRTFEGLNRELDI